ncbi:MAG: hypothetical protein KKB21_04200 [Nanoarchaeota archaeon]|nr:hypothetical protein [Nanoarchaeota archaeon]
MTIEEQIDDLHYQIHKIDGKSLGWNIGNRITGLAKIGLQLLFYYASDKNPLTLVYLPVAIDGAADLITGMHHTLMFRILRVHPKYKLAKILSEQERIDV